MKKLIPAFSVAILSILLSACTSGLDERQPVAREANIKHVCINERKTGLNYTSQETVQFIQNSLKKKGISSEVFSKTANCPNVLKYAFKGHKDVALRGTMVLVSLGDDKNVLGEVGYYRRGEERDISNQAGFEGQIDRMISELFKNY